MKVAPVLLPPALAGAVSGWGSPGGGDTGAGSVSVHNVGTSRVSVLGSAGGVRAMGYAGPAVNTGGAFGVAAQAGEQLRCRVEISINSLGRWAARCPDAAPGRPELVAAARYYNTVEGGIRPGGNLIAGGGLEG